MKSRSIIWCLCLLILACNPDKDKRVDNGEISFKTTDSSKLYFKNIRQPYYDLEEMPAAKLEIFRLKKRVLSEEKPIINLSIANNWRYDEAYILLETNDLIHEDTLRVKWNNEEGLANGNVQYSKGNKTDIARFADIIYQQIQNKSQFEIEIDGKWIPFLADANAREAFRITMFDYYKLVQRL